MNYSFHRDAERELEEAENYYDNIDEQLGNRFRAEVEISIARILAFPELWHPLTKTVRRRRLTSFPYGIKPYQEYLRPIVARLQTMTPDQFQPHLDVLERLIMSLEVRPK